MPCGAGFFRKECVEVVKTNFGALILRPRVGVVIGFDNAAKKFFGLAIGAFISEKILNR